MTSKRSEDLLVSLLRSAYRNARHGSPARTSTSLASRPLSSLAAPSSLLHSSIRKQVACSRSGKFPRSQTRTFATVKADNGKTREIAVLGGGVTGLTAAHYLARYAKDAHITLYEASDRLGGWIHGQLVPTGNGDEKILFQSGPRMLRPGGASLKYDDLVFYDVLINLGIEHKLLPHEGLPNARYIYYPDHLVKLPDPSRKSILEILRSYLTEPIWDGALKSAFNAALAAMNTPPDSDSRSSLLEQDESVGESLGRLFKDDRHINNIISAIAHGIYGGDVYKLSVKHTIFEPWWRSTILPSNHDNIYLELKELVLELGMSRTPNRNKIATLANKAVHWKTMAFEDGLLTLKNSLIEDLRNQRNVTVKTSTPVTSLAYKDDRVSVTSTDKKKQKQTKQYDQVISTIFSKHLAGLVEPKGSLTSLSQTHAVTIMVVNIWFPNPNLLANNPGFGYLVPTSTPDNDACILGVLFDSDMELSSSERRGTKLTVMMGGHYWDGWVEYPTEEMASAIALEAVQRHLGIDPAEAEQAVTHAYLARECLPQHFVGHQQRMKDAHYELLKSFQGRLSVAGPSYTTIGVMPAMRAGCEAAMRVARGHGPPWFYHERHGRRLGAVDDDGNYHEFPDHVGVTGLLGFTRPYAKTLCQVESSSLRYKRWWKGYAVNNGK
ncbi:Protoporphyrinogen oxidase [Daldinia caldariorum]|uniref:Protoporphyrinogen oxidase n=1 Tax=Daldinia caldariorum TaxID=326644 RepID=UPI002007C41E|nr:Protoporphyrinogen oxidase [Daldinia caldariorum]KAI1465719.1 Protoporphyrinogen oxidase [Daldinia caldariorum]